MKMVQCLLLTQFRQASEVKGTPTVVDYEGFQDAEAPDLETWSKALNAGQYPLSVLSLNGSVPQNCM